jgi:cytochrome P450
MTVLDNLESDLARLVATDTEMMTNPWPTWRALREAGPVIQAADGYWITRYEDARTVLQNADVFGNDTNRQGTRSEAVRASMTPPQQAAFDEINDFAAMFFMNTDDPQHTRLRRIAQRAFTPARIGMLEQAAIRYVDEILEEIAGDDVSDLMQLAYRMPLMIIGDLLGVPPGDRQLIKDWSTIWFEYRRRPDDRILESAQAARDFRGYVEELIEQHKAHPSEHAGSLISDLLGAEQDERLSEVELAGTFFVLLFAGHETTTNLIGTGALELLSNRSEWDALLADPSLFPNAIDELLRYVTPVQWSDRVVRRSAEVAGVEIPVGSTALVSLACANRDPREFDDPDRLDVGRPEARKQIAFAFGPHFCLGANLARLEGLVALQALVTRFPRTELAADTFEWRGAPNIRGLAALPVHLEGAEA